MSSSPPLHMPPSSSRSMTPTVIGAAASVASILQEMALIDRTVEGGLLRGVERAGSLDQALDIVMARNRTAQDRLGPVLLQLQTFQARKGGRVSPTL